MEYSGKNTLVGSLSLLLGIIPTQGLNPVSLIAGSFFTVWATWEAHFNTSVLLHLIISTCISLMTKYVEHFFVYVFAMCMYSLITCMCGSFTHFLIELSVFLLFSSVFSLCLGISSLSDMSFANILSHSVACLFILFVFSWAKVFSKVYLVSFFFLDCAFAVVSKNSLSNLRSHRDFRLYFLLQVL